MSTSVPIPDILGAPDALLVPWVARWAGTADLGLVALAAAAVGGELRPNDRWPAVADAAAEVLAARAPCADLPVLLDLLPPIARYLATSHVAEDPQHNTRLLLPENAETEMSGSLRADADPYQLVYELSFGHHPFKPWQERALEAVWGSTDVPWYQAVVTTRLLPYLDDTGRAAIRDIVEFTEEPWRTHLVGLTRQATTQWPSAVAELSAAHWATSLLDDYAQVASPDEVITMCRLAATFVLQNYDEADRWGVSALDPVPRHDPRAVVAPETQTPLGTKVERHVNVYVAEAGRPEPIRDRPLTPGVVHAVVFGIGAIDSRSLIVADRRASFPEDCLPDGPLTLTAVLIVEGSVTGTVAFELPDTGASDWQNLALPVGTSEGVTNAELAIYHHAALIHLVCIAAPVGGPADRGGPTADVRFQLTRSFKDLGRISERRTSVLGASTGSSSIVVVNGLDFMPNAFSPNSDQIDTAAKAARRALHDIHFRKPGENLVSKYNSDLSKAPKELVSDLRTLASLGRKIYTSIFPNAAIAESLPDILRAEAGGRERPPIIQIVDLTERLSPVPWSILYDMPLGSTPEKFEICPSIAELASNRLGSNPPAKCPYEDRHRHPNGWREDQLCPWGFWGLSAEIEHPPHVYDRELESVVGTGSETPSFLIADDPGLDRNLRIKHLNALKVSLGPLIMPVDAVDKYAIRTALADDVDVVYFYCHSAYQMAAAGVGAEPELRFGSGRITPADINSWASAKEHWPPSHWADRHPLIVINGCHTTEFLAGTLNTFATTFTNAASASGVVGTEITMEQGVAGWAMEIFLDAMRTMGVGEALRRTRWAMLGRGNAMGFAYTPYCLSNLKLRHSLREMKC